MLWCRNKLNKFNKKNTNLFSKNTKRKGLKQKTENEVRMEMELKNKKT